MAFVQLIQLWAMFYKENEVGGKFDPMEDHSTRGSYYGDENDTVHTTSFNFLGEFSRFRLTLNGLTLIRDS